MHTRLDIDICRRDWCGATSAKDRGTRRGGGGAVEPRDRGICELFVPWNPPIFAILAVFLSALLPDFLFALRLSRRPLSAPLSARERGCGWRRASPELPGIYRIISRWLRGSHSGGYQCPRPSRPHPRPRARGYHTVHACNLHSSPTLSLSPPLFLTLFRSVCLSAYPSIHLSVHPSSSTPLSAPPLLPHLILSTSPFDRSSVLRASSTELSIYLSSSPCVSISPSIALASSVYLSLCPSPPPPPLSLFLSVYFSILLSISPPRWSRCSTGERRQRSPVTQTRAQSVLPASRYWRPMHCWLPHYGPWA